MLIRAYIVLLTVVLFGVIACTRTFGLIELLVTTLPLLYVALDCKEPA